MPLQPNLPVPIPPTEMELAYIEDQPEGLFPDNQDSNFGQLRKVITDQLQAAADQIQSIYNERFPLTSTDYITYWEEELALPQNPPSLTLLQRQNVVLNRLRKGYFTRAARDALINTFITATFGPAISLGPGGVVLGSGVPLYSGITSGQGFYTVTEDIPRFRYFITLDPRITIDNVAFAREMTRITPAGIQAIFANQYVKSGGGRTSGKAGGIKPQNLYQKRGGGIARTVGGGTKVVSTGVPALTSAPVATGTPSVGSLLNSTTGSWTNSPTSYAYDWQNDASGTFQSIDNGIHTSPNYQVQSIDQGHNVRCKVTAINAAGSATAFTNSINIASGPANLLYQLHVGTTAFTGLDYQDDTTVTSDTSISRGHLSIINDPDGSGRKAVQNQIFGGIGQREAAEMLMPFDPVLGRHRFIGLGIRWPSNWASLPRGSEASGFWGALFFQGQYAGIHGDPIGLAAQADRVSIDVASGNSTFGQNSQYQTNLINGGTGGPISAPTVLGRQVGRPGELATAPMTLNVWHFFIVELVEAWDFTGMLAIWHKQQGDANWLKTWELDNIPTHQYTGSWSAFGRNDKHGYYSINVGAVTTILRDGWSSSDTLAGAAASLGA